MPEVVKNGFSSNQIAELAFAEIRWKEFDAVWYRRRYQDVLSEEELSCDDKNLEKIWEEKRSKEKRSPNRFFDEKWYLYQNSGVFKAIIQNSIFDSGFQHYVEVGYRSCSPHWLFDEEEYFRRNIDVSYRGIHKKKFINSYDYFLKVGDKERQIPHRFFDPNLFINECLKENIVFNFDEGGYSQYLSLKDPKLAFVRTSWYFDPKWYVERYPNLKEIINSGQYITPLQHYLECDNPQDYDPNPFFSEQYYCERYKDVQEAVENGIFRNGYAHFISSGVYESRQPHPDVDLIHFRNSYDIKNLLLLSNLSDIFALWIKIREKNLPDLPNDAMYETYQKLSIGYVEAAFPSMFRSPLYFSFHNSPDLNIIVISEGDYFSVAATLIALHQQYGVTYTITVVSNGNNEEKKRIEQLSQGINVLCPGCFVSDADLLSLGLEDAQSNNVIIIRAGMQLASGALEHISKLMKNTHISGGCGQIIGTDGYVIEAGSRLWRDGSITSNGKGLKISESEAGYKTILEVGQEGFFFGRRDELLKTYHLVKQCGLEAGFAPLALALRVQNKILYYAPDVIVKSLYRRPLVLEKIQRQSQAIKNCFSSILVRHPLLQGGEWRDRSSFSDVVMIFPYLPSLKEGVVNYRFFKQIEEFQRRGWNVTVIGLEAREKDRLVISLDYPETVECISGIEDLLGLLKKRIYFIKILWINSVQVLSSLASLIIDNSIEIPIQSIVLDTVKQNGSSLHSTEMYLRRLVGGNDDQKLLMDEAKKELSNAWICQCIIAGDDMEADTIRNIGFNNVCVMPLVVEELSEKEHGLSFDERRGLLFPLSIHNSGDAVHDGFDWFCLSIVPYLKEFLPEDVPIWIGGYYDSSVNLKFYERFASLEGINRSIPHSDLMKKCRVLVAPMRVLSTQATEIIEGAMHDLPSVMGASLMDRIKWKDRYECLDGGFNDSKRFAKNIAELYQDETLWLSLQKEARKRVMKENNLKSFQAVFSEILNVSMGKSKIFPSHISNSSRSLKRQFNPAVLSFRPKSGIKKQEENLDENKEDENQDSFLQTRLGVDLN